ncbi:MAG TPA: vanadium-dependent haloperoxidase [Longimicrobium sp.]|nr:vanadium-dependent haloperoxidase [Longimicrobium sp.]
MPCYVPTCPTQTPPQPDRRQAAQNVRAQASALANVPIPTHRNNCEEQDYPYVFNYSKALQHDALGDVLPASYQSLLNALQTKTHASFEAIQDGPGPKRLTNPQSGLAFQLQGFDPAALRMPPAPRMDRPRAAAEMAELYWMALARDIPFIDWATQAGNPSSVIARAARSLTSPWLGGEFSEFWGPKENGFVTHRTLFRGVYVGELIGPYVSQFLLKGNAEPGVPAGEGLRDTDGEINYGAQTIPQRIRTSQPGTEYLTSFATWLQAQNGADFRGQDVLDPTRRYIRSLRDLGEYVHNDLVINAWYNACWYLLNEPSGNQIDANVGAVPMVNREFPLDQGNPYLASTKQDGFVTFGPLHALQVVCDIIGRAGSAVWWQKWFVHRRLRPEEAGGRIHNHLTNARWYPIHYQILWSLRWGLLANYFPRNGTYLLPQQFPEGAPTHPAYGAGHATISGACATILKAFFNEDARIENPVQAAANGLSLVPYTGADAACMTVGTELNKLAGNIAIGRNAAGVHWRTDYDQSLLLGEAVAIEVLRELSLTYNEPHAFVLTRFNGQRIRISGGRVRGSYYYYVPRGCRVWRYPNAIFPYAFDPCPRWAYAGAPADATRPNAEYQGAVPGSATVQSSGTASAEAVTGGTVTEEPSYKTPDAQGIELTAELDDESVPLATDTDPLAGDIPQEDHDQKQAEAQGIAPSKDIRPIGTSSSPGTAA